MSKKKKRSKASSPTGRNQRGKIKRTSKKPIYDSDSSSLSEGEIADERPKKKQIVKKRYSKKYDSTDESMEISDESDSRTQVQEQSMGKCVMCIMKAFDVLPNVTQL